MNSNINYGKRGMETEDFYRRSCENGARAMNGVIKERDGQVFFSGDSKTTVLATGRDGSKRWYTAWVVMGDILRKNGVERRGVERSR